MYFTIRPRKEQLSYTAKIRAINYGNYTKQKFELHLGFSTTHKVFQLSVSYRTEITR